jgi:hypothetical protein
MGSVLPDPYETKALYQIDALRDRITVNRSHRGQRRQRLATGVIGKFLLS